MGRVCCEVFAKLGPMQCHDYRDLQVDEKALKTKANAVR